MCQKLKLWLSLLGLLLFLSGSVSLWAEDTTSNDTSLKSDSSITNTPEGSPNLIQSGSSLNEAWTMLKNELMESAKDSEAQLNLLEKLQTETEELRYSYQSLMGSYEKEKQARDAERAASEALTGKLESDVARLNRSISIWKPVAIFSSCAFVSLGAIMLAYSH